MGFKKIYCHQKVCNEMFSQPKYYPDFYAMLKVGARAVVMPRHGVDPTLGTRDRYAETLGRCVAGQAARYRDDHSVTKILGQWSGHACWPLPQHA